ncbi:MAG: polysaccharide biosynthesis protein [Tenericutes bacterium]|nr:polysaccharide biosynthesis protein [Bacilli bacterium]NLV90304.1 polysaccharide biosynthesis protein [Mycoplasmatota bacterium]
MKKNSFMSGAVVATSSIVISRIIGVLYAIILYPMIGEKGGALYGYAYSIYSLFLGISIAGVPFAISKITSEYEALEYHYAKEKAYKIGKIFITTLGLIGFILMFVFSEQIGYMFIGDIKGGNTIEEVSFVIRVIATALLVVPILSVSRGYLQGHKYITASSLSQVIEQISRVTFLLVGIYLSLYVFKIGLTYSVGVAVFGATVGALFAYLYLFLKIKKQKNIKEIGEIKEEEKKIKALHIIKTIIIYAVPFILIDVVRSGYKFVDLANLNKTMVNLGYLITDAEAVTSIISTWGTKLDAVVYSISVGIIVSMIPNINSSYAKGDKEDIRKKVNTSIQALLFVVVPLVFMMSILSEPIWTVFYGYSELGTLIFQVFIIRTIFVVVYNLTCSVLNCISMSKIVIVTGIIGLILKLIFNIPMMNLMEYIGMHPAHGLTVSSIIAFGVSALINFYYIKNKIDINYKSSFKKIGQILFGTTIMVIVMMLMQFIIPMETQSRLISFVIAGVYAIIGTIIYMLIMIKNKSFYEIFGNTIFDKIKSKLKKRV